MNKIGKIVLLGLALAFLMKEKSVNASNEFISSDELPGVTYKIKHDGKTWRLYFHVVKDKITGEPVYCIEPGVRVEESSYELVELANAMKVNLTEEKLKKVSAIAHFGLNDTDHTSMNYYIAAQSLIWETVVPSDWQIYLTDSLDGEKVNWYDKERYDILYSIKEYETLPSFHQQTFTYNQMDVLEITDKNDVLKEYNLQKNDLNIQKKDNKLLIKNKKDPETIVLERKENGPLPQLYYSENGQDIIRKGVLLPNQMQFQIKPYSLNFELVKTGEKNNIQKPLSGVTFSLFAKEDIKNKNGVLLYAKNSLIENLKTDDLGKIFKNNLPDGSYCLKEIDAPKEYKINDTPICFTLNEKNPVFKATKSNFLKRYSAKIKKVDAESGVPLPNIFFRIQDEFGNVVLETKTDEFGEILLEDLILGTYKITEIETIDGYELLKEPVFFTIEDENIEIKITNHKITNVPKTSENRVMIPKSILFRKEEEL